METRCQQPTFSRDQRANTINKAHLYTFHWVLAQENSLLGIEELFSQLQRHMNKRCNERVIITAQLQNNSKEKKLRAFPVILLF